MTARWNAIVSLVLGIVALIVFVTSLVTGVGLTSFILDRSGFIINEVLVSLKRFCIG